MSTSFSVASSTTAQQALAADASRISAVFQNTGPGACYLKWGGSDPTTSFGGYDIYLVEGAIATGHISTAPEIIEELRVVWSTASVGQGLTGEYSVRSGGLSNDSTTLGDLKELIASDLERTLTDTSHAALSRTWDDEIGVAIGDAIQLYRSKHWWFLQEPATADLTSTCTSGNSYLGDYPGLIQLDSLLIEDSTGQLQDMIQVAFKEMDRLHLGTSTDTGLPYLYCRHGGRVRLYPTPDGDYTFTWSGLFEQATLTADTISNAWMTHGRLVVKAMAKLIMLRDYIKSYEDVPAAQQAVQIAEHALDREHVRRTSTRSLAARC